VTRYSDIRLAGLLAALRPPPEDWERKAERIAMEQTQLPHILARAEGDPGFRADLLEDAEGALERAGYEPDRDTVETVRWRLRRE
jgi:hypothetical protein